ncbi:predicted protein [Naegleria gruberi]|uniref:Predicted protein n=1 Tax=Naegleria gruberi TaxID=5762 RepID=D2VZC8_NAEGR|nr:uncharacterized protein NAEGRDRAFT_59667 [Naegleria gruberi]EFC37768.1 predicted protein [Naegleria gruberi]|eukprot:XP_002670512.1 predicted protein [Naegleria gruberi strain NEG-M]
MTKRVLIFGQSGVGKSSMINALANSKLPVLDGAVGTTFESEEVSFKDSSNQEILLIDTVGLSESATGTSSSIDSFIKLKNLLKKSTCGFNLMIFVTTKDRITGNDKANIELFKTILGDDKVPVIMVVNKSENLEDCENMVLDLESNQWVTKNLLYIEQVYGKDCFACIKSTSFPCTKGDDLTFSEEEKKLVSEASRRIVLAMINKYSSKESVVLIRSSQDLFSKLVRMWNLFLFKTGETAFKIGIDLQSFSSVGKLAEKLKVIFKADINFLELAMDLYGIGVNNNEHDVACNKK